MNYLNEFQDKKKGMFMTRGEFLRELEYLLKDIPESDRADAIAYYNNYAYLCN